MSISDQERWDARWAEPKSAHVREPHPLLVRFVSQNPCVQGRALDVACGVGQNAVWLAQHGFAVDAVDISPVALEHAQRSAAQAGLAPRAVNFIQADLEVWSPAPQAYDLVVGFRFLNRRLWPRLQAALRPGGWLVYQTFNLRRLNPDSDCPFEYLLKVGELLRTFSGWEIIESGDDGGSGHDQSWLVCRKL